MSGTMNDDYLGRLQREFAGDGIRQFRCVVTWAGGREEFRFTPPARQDARLFVVGEIPHRCPAAFVTGEYTTTVVPEEPARG